MTAASPAADRRTAGAACAGLRRLLRVRGGRLTPQRLAIYEAVVGQTTHPSVEMVHAAVRTRFPGVSRATVYTTLGLFADLCLIQEVGGRVRRYDGRAGRHVNLVCERCGGVTDIADPRLEALERRTAMRAGFDVRSARFELHGVCPRCRAQSRRAGASARGEAAGGRRVGGRPAAKAAGRRAEGVRDA
ncbi:MAG TPA: Fur family transcriptional regulator [bacterium]|nr:Fur family transcriptional regulator [bacterium]